ncbi:hypothetical protein ZIOFF_042780 [Zingiber officinale]|uniref:Uncharacterized protein n=1 Tax=Zingiber officinale TaxID=94328 RepID=A0A8J5FS39_ZINOF|nr:hypothetical protein ZIOFF_042780 [Zingiber officinale]
MRAVAVGFVKKAVTESRARGRQKSVCDSRNGGDASLLVLELYSSKAEDETAAVLSDLSLFCTAITHGFVSPAINNHPVSCHKCTKESPEASLVAARNRSSLGR